MNMIHWGMLMLLVLAVPFFLGMIPVSYTGKQHKTPTFVWLSGWLVMFTVFELVGIPFILLEKKFSALVLVYSIVIVCLVIFSLFFGRNIWKELVVFPKEERKNRWSILAWALFFMMLLFQIYMAVFYEYYDGDDAYYLAVPVLSNTYDTMYLRDCYTGFTYDLDIRHAMSPTPIFIGWLAKLSGIHSTIIAHSVLSVVWLILMYCVYGEMSKYLFKKEKQYRPLFMCLISLWYIFGNVTISTAETFIMTRTWQGKGLFAGVLLPCIFLCFLMLIEKRETIGAWIMLVMLGISSVFSTSVAFMLVPTMYGLGAVFIGWKKKDWRFVFKMFFACIPVLLLALCFVLNR